MDKPEIIDIGKWGNPSLEFEVEQQVIKQRDADVAYYEPLIQQTVQNEAHRQSQKRIKLREYYQARIQQAKAEVAREIFTEVRKLKTPYHPTLNSVESEAFEVAITEVLRLESQYEVKK